jgi:hypothetical protein
VIDVISKLDPVSLGSAPVNVIVPHVSPASIVAVPLIVLVSAAVQVRSTVTLVSTGALAYAYATTLPEPLA